MPRAPPPIAAWAKRAFAATLATQARRSHARKAALVVTHRATSLRRRDDGRSTSVRLLLRLLRRLLRMAPGRSTLLLWTLPLLGPGACPLGETLLRLLRRLLRMAPGRSTRPLGLTTAGRATHRQAARGSVRVEAAAIRHPHIMAPIASRRTRRTLCDGRSTLRLCVVTGRTLCAAVAAGRRGLPLPASAMAMLLLLVAARLLLKLPLLPGCIGSPTLLLLQLRRHHMIVVNLQRLCRPLPCCGAGEHPRGRSIRAWQLVRLYSGGQGSSGSGRDRRRRRVCCRHRLHGGGRQTLSRGRGTRLINFAVISESSDQRALRLRLLFRRRIARRWAARQGRR